MWRFSVDFLSILYILPSMVAVGSPSRRLYFPFFKISLLILDSFPSWENTIFSSLLIFRCRDLFFLRYYSNSPSEYLSLRFFNMDWVCSTDNNVLKYGCLSKLYWRSNNSLKEIVLLILIVHLCGLIWYFCGYSLVSSLFSAGWWSSSQNDLLSPLSWDFRLDLETDTGFIPGFKCLFEGFRQRWMLIGSDWKCRMIILPYKDSEGYVFSKFPNATFENQICQNLTIPDKNYGIFSAP